MCAAMFRAGDQRSPLQALVTSGRKNSTCNASAAFLAIAFRFIVSKFFSMVTSNHIFFEQIKI